MIQVKLVEPGSNLKEVFVENIIASRKFASIQCIEAPYSTGFSSGVSGTSLRSTQMSVWTLRLSNLPSPCQL
jgi:hypothetical protein